MTNVQAITPIAKELLELEKKALDSFFEEIDAFEMEKVLKLLVCCKGLIFFTGVGKSGLIAEKIAWTFTSCGTKALYLNPTNALHGDLGIAGEGDLCVLLSKSGESQELIDLVPALKHRNIKTLSFVCNPQSKLAKMTDDRFCLPQVSEICPFDLAPTTSTAIQLIVGDILAVGLMRIKNMTLQEFASSHPAGRIGKRITLKVSDLMLENQDLPLAFGDVILLDSLVELSNKKCGCLLIVDEDKRLLGIFTDGDLRRSLEKLGSDCLKMPLAHLMTKQPKSIDPDEFALKALEVMEGNGASPITALPVVRDGVLFGLLRMHDIIQVGI